jgi:hypothetical protein
MPGYGMSYGKTSGMKKKKKAMRRRNQCVNLLVEKSKNNPLLFVKSMI